MTLWRERLSNVSSQENLQVGNPLNYKGDGHAMRTMDYTRVYTLRCDLWLVRVQAIALWRKLVSPTGLFSSSSSSSLASLSRPFLCRLPGPSYFHLALTNSVLLQSARLANVASRDEVELQERRILRTSLSSRETRISTGQRKGERYADKFDCDIPFPFKSLANSPINGSSVQMLKVNNPGEFTSIYSSAENLQFL